MKTEEVWRLEWSTGQQAWHLEPASLPRRRLAGWRIVAQGAPEVLEDIIAAKAEAEKLANTLDLMALAAALLPAPGSWLTARAERG